MDPDIPIKHQRVQFNSNGTEDVTWLLDGISVGNGIEVGWTPSGGRHKLALTDIHGNELDSVIFEVRGAI